MNKISRFSCVLLLSVFWATNALAASFGLIASTRVTEPCAQFNETGGWFCGPGETNADEHNAFGSGINSIVASTQHPGQAGANGSASGTLDISNIGLPELSAYAQSGVDSEIGTFVDVEAINLYTYTGPDNFALQLTSAFHGTTTGNATVMFGQAALFSSSSLDATMLMTELDMGNSIGELIDEFIEPLDFDSFFTQNGGTETFNLSVSRTVNDGDQFYVYAKFGGFAVDGGVFDGLNTATILLNTTEVEIASAAIPLPGALPLLGSALAFAAWLRRRVGLARAALTPA